MAMTPPGLFTEAPPVAGLVRSRLIHALQGPAGPTRLGLVVAPPGSGKTTLLSHWAAQNFGSIAWNRLQPADGQPGQLLGRFAAAVAAAAKEECARSYKDIIAMAQALTTSLCFVIDDFHVVAGSGASAELEQLISLCFPHIHFLIGSRRPPTLNLARSELPSLVTVDWDDLRFRTYEVEQLFRTTYQQPLSTAGVYNLTKRTDGWAAALHFFHVATKNRPTVERRRTAESTGAVPRYGQEFLENHFFAPVSPAIEAMLRCTCLLETLTTSRCNVLLRTHAAGVLLREAERLGILISDDGGTTFRLPEVARQYLASTLNDDDGTGDIRNGTALILEQECDYRGTLQVLAEGRDWHHIRAVMHRVGGEAIRAGACAWITSVPESLIKEDPVFALAKARQLFDDGRAAEALLAASSLPRGPAPEGWDDIATDLMRAAAEWTSERHASATEPVGMIRAAIHGSPGTAARSADKLTAPEDALARGIALLIAGDQRAAMPFLRRCAEQPEDATPAALCARLALAIFAQELPRSGFDLRAEELDAIQRRAERLGFSWIARLARGTLATQLSPATSHTAGRLAPEIFEQDEDPWGAALIAAVVALERLHCGKPEYETFDALADRFRRLGACSLEAWALSARALVAAARDLPEALEEAMTAEAFARAADVPGAQAVAYAAMAQLNPEHSPDLMGVAAETARSAGLACRPWTWLNLPLATMPPSASPLQHPVATPAASNASRSAPACPPALEVRCFGEFSFRVHGVSLDLSRVRPQARIVLKMLALHAGRPVHREQLWATLWGDLDSASAIHNLQVSLSSLRRALLSDKAADCPLLVRRGEAYALVLDGKSRVDLLEFDQATREAALARSAGDPGRAADVLRRAVELYAGEVLPEDGPAYWLTDIRERYRLHAAEAAAALAGLELEFGKPVAATAAAARSVEIDPWRDEAWRILIAASRSSGDLAAAERAERRYKDILNELGVPAGNGFALGAVSGRPEN